MKLSPLLNRLWAFISFRRRKQLTFLFVLVIITSFTEVVAIGAVLPFLAVLAKPEAVFNHDFAQPIIQGLDITDPTQLILPLTLGFVSAAVVAGGLRILLLWVQARLGHAIGADLSCEIFRRTLYQPYSVHVSRNSSEIIAAITSKTNQVVGGVINPVIMLTSSAFLMLVILATLLLIEPVVALLGMAGFGLIYGVIVTSTRKRLVDNSRRVSLGGNRVVKIVQEGLGGIRDILIDGTQSAYCNEYREADVPMRRAQANSYVIGLTPRYGIEAISMVLIAVISYVLSDSKGGLMSALPILGAFALGAQRLLPALQQVYANYSTMCASHAILSDALALLEQRVDVKPEGQSFVPLHFERSIELRNINFRYALNTPWILDNVNIVISKGEKVGFIGTTGSGKSTLLDIIMGLLSSDEGQVVIDGRPVNEANFRSWQAKIAHVPQAIFLVDATIAQNIAFGVLPEDIDYDLVSQCAVQANIAATIESWTLGYETQVGERGVRLSGGQRQRIGIARALYKQADVLVFDEATSALDNETEASVMSAIDKVSRDITVLIVAHRLTTLKNCDQIIELENGSVSRSGSYANVVGLS